MDRVSEYELPYRGGDSGVKYLFRGPNIDWGVILLKPGEELRPHYHNQVEETFYVLSGQPTFILGDCQYAGLVGDAYRMEPGEAHALANRTQKEAKLVFIKVPYLPDDKVDL